MPTIKITDLELYTLCVQELADPAFDSSSHATQSTYRQGCRGPMCTYARSRSRSDRQGGMNFLSNDLIEYIIVLLWAQSGGPRARKIYEAPRTILIFYSRLKAKGMTAEIDKMLDENFPFVGIPAETPPADPLAAD